MIGRPRTISKDIARVCSSRQQVDYIEWGGYPDAAYAKSTIVFITEDLDWQWLASKARHFEGDDREFSFVMIATNYYGAMQDAT